MLLLKMNEDIVEVHVKATLQGMGGGGGQKLQLQSSDKRKILNYHWNNIKDLYTG